MKIVTTYMKLREPYAENPKGKLAFGGPKKACLRCGKYQYNRLCILFQNEDGTKQMQHVCMNCLLYVFETGRVVKEAGKVTKRSELTCYLCERGLCSVCKAKGIDRKPVSAVGGIWLKNGHDSVAICLQCVKYRCLNIEPAEH